MAVADHPQKTLENRNVVEVLPTWGEDVAEGVTPSAYFRWKGPIDCILAAILLVVAGPIIGLLVLLVRLTSRGPGIYRQRRVGKAGRPFVMYKIRSMRQNAEAQTGAVWTQVEDPRITRVGKVLRRLHLDEFPQLFNVLKGEMALIGPRPERPEFIRVLAQKLPTYLDRLAVRPGVTGFAQVHLEPDSDLDSVRQKLVCDLQYIRHAGPLLEVRIILCTLAHILGLSRSRAVRLTGLHRMAPTVDHHGTEADDASDVSVVPAGATDWTVRHQADVNHGRPSHGPRSEHDLRKRSRFGCTRRTDPLNALTIDLEDYFHVTAFEKDIPRSQWNRFDCRIVPNTKRLLGLLDRHDVKATFFVLGWVAQRFPELVQEIHSAGHEIGSHGYWHRLVYEQSPEEFRLDLRQSREVLGDAIGEAVTAYRAPSFSITRKSLWALDILVEEGFRVDSSIMPIHHDRYGIPNAESGLHRREATAGWLWEFAPSVVRLVGSNFPVGGGGYFRLYPLGWTLYCLSRLNRRSQQPFVFYAHPWEIDPAQPRLKAGSRFSRFRHRVNLATTEQKLDTLLRSFRFGRLCDVIEQKRP